MSINDLFQEMTQILSSPFSGDANKRMMGLYRQAKDEIERHLTALVDDHGYTCLKRENERVYRRYDSEWDELSAIRTRWMDWHPATQKAA